MQGRTQCDVTDVSICVGNTGPGAGQVEIERAQLMACHEARWQLVMRPGTRPQLSRVTSRDTTTLNTTGNAHTSPLDWERRTGKI